MYTYEIANKQVNSVFADLTSVAIELSPWKQFFSATPLLITKLTNSSIPKTTQPDQAKNPQSQ